MKNPRGPEILVFGCAPEDRRLLRTASASSGSVVRTVASRVEIAKELVSRRPAAVFLGVNRDTLAHLEVIPLIRAVSPRVRVIVVAEDDSLDVERRAREKSVFYYLVHPLQEAETEAVLRDVLREQPR